MSKILKYPKNYFEKQAWKNKFYVCGIDEVGRGCLAGPLVVAAVILPHNTIYSLKDSKILTENQRESAYHWIVCNALYSVVVLGHDVIDKINIYQSTLRAMKRAYVQLIEVLPFNYELIKYLVVDAMPLHVDLAYQHATLETHYFPYGESISKSIAAASIVAKVTRDRLMGKIEPVIPGFNLAQHKGYGTREHIALIRRSGASIIHRKSFLEGIYKDEHESSKQQNIFI